MDACAQRPTKHIRIIIVDDNAILRDSLSVLLNCRAAIEVVGTYGNGRDAVTGARLLHPDVALMDVTMPLLNGLEATRQIKRDLPATRVLIMSGVVSSDRIRDAINAGASGYLTKSVSSTELVVAIESVRTGSIYFSTDIVNEFDIASITKQARAAHPSSSAQRLTNRQREVLQLVAEGWTSRRIGEFLSISPKTVDAHKARMMDTLDIRSRSGLIRFALSNGLVPGGGASPRDRLVDAPSTEVRAAQSSVLQGAPLYAPLVPA